MQLLFTKLYKVLFVTGVLWKREYRTYHRLTGIVVSCGPAVVYLKESTDNRAFLYILLKTELFPIQLLLKRIENEIQFLANNTDLSVTEALTIQESIPGETVKMALVVLVVMPIIVAFPFFQKYFVKGITVGAVKG